MKMAKVVSVRDRGPLTSDPNPCMEAGTGDDFASALRRYPDISEQERRALLRFLRRASRTQIRDAVLRRGLEGRMIAFRKSHKAQLRRGWWTWAPFIFALLGLAELLRLLV